MSIFEIFKQFNLKNVENILIYDVTSLTIDDAIELSKYVDNLYIIFSSNFLVSSFGIKLRFYRNIKILFEKFTPNINFNLVFSSSLTNVYNFLIENDKIQYYIDLSDNSNYSLHGYDKISNNIFKRQRNKLLINIDNNENIDKKQKTYFEINIKNIASSFIKYKSNIKEKNINGILDIFCICDNELELQTFFDKLNIVEKQYSYIKTYLVLNGVSSSKFNFRKINNLIKFENKLNHDIIDNMLNEMLSDEYVLHLNKIDLNKLNNIWDFLG